MAVLALHCPYCHTENTAFHSAASVPYPNTPSLYAVLMICNKCGGGVVAKIIDNPHSNPAERSGDLSKTPGVSIQDIQPRASMPSIPAHVPDHVGKYYWQAVRNLQQEHYDASGIMCRKVLECVTRNLGAVHPNLFQRIEALANEHKLTQAMKDWAHAIRLDGNDAAHADEPLDETVAQDLLNFTELLLMYAYTLPGMLEARKARQAA